MDGESRRRGSVLLKGVRGIFPEIFEKSIDKHKIDAILECAVQSERSYTGCFGSGRDASRRIPRKKPALTIPIQSAVEDRRGFHVLMCMEGNGGRILCAELRGVL